MDIIKKTERIINIEYQIHHELLSTYVNVDNFTNGNDLHVVTINTISKITGFTPSNSTSSWGNIVSSELLNKIIEQPHLAASIYNEDKTKTIIQLCHENYLKHHVEIGRYDNYFVKNENDMKNDLLPFEKRINNSFYQYVEHKNNDAYLTIWKNSQNHYYCEPMHFDYIGAALHNGKYHLDLLSEYLSTRDDIAFIIEKNYSHLKSLLRTPLLGTEKEINQIISDIPSYNASDEENESINILYFPKQEAIEQIVQWKQNEQDYNLDRFALSKLLNCDQFVKETVKEEEIITPKRKFKK